MSITSKGTPLAAGIARAATGAWDPVEFHQAAGIRVALTRRGRGPAVVCLHATGHGARDFEAFAARVARDFEVIAVDWPGQGRSEADTEPASAARYSRILEDLLPRLAAGPVVLLGCSIGGAAAIEVAARRGDLVRGLVLCDPGGLVVPDAATRLAVRAMVSFFAAGARGASWFPAAFALYYRMVLPGAAARPQRDRIVAAVRETAPVLAEAWASFGAPAADLRGLAPRIGCPTLFAWARQDRVLPWSRSRAAAETFPDVRVEFFRGGHAAFLEDPDRFAQTFLAFASDLAGAPRARPASGSRAEATIGPWKQAGAA